MEQAVRTYANLMEEVKLRTEAIDAVLIGTMKPIRAKVAEEICFLQLRMICELIALGCLVIHGDVKGTQTKIVQKRWEADQILKILDTLHPKFYPTPLHTGDVAGSPYPEAMEKKSGFLTKSELIQLYHDCGKNLHRGTARNVLKAMRTPDFSAIRKWRNGVVELLTRHKFTMSDERWECWVIMRNANSNGSVGWNIMQRIGKLDEMNHNSV